MAILSKQLVVQVTSLNVWSQLCDGAGGSAYAVPTSGSNPRGDIKMLRAINYSSGSATVALAISSGSPPSAYHEVWPHYGLASGYTMIDDSVHVAKTGEKLWAKVSADTSGSPNMVFRASLLEAT